ncbi:MAG: HAD family hydrolase [Acidobacteria bacterium]|nr:HAD family hydrolase [Acidobacteriota bacterium]
MIGNDYRGIRLVSWDVDGTLFSYGRLAVELLRLGPFKLRELRDAWVFHWSVERQRRQASSAVVSADMDRMRETRLREREALAEALRRMSPRKRALQLIERFAALRIPQVAWSDFDCDYKLVALRLSSYFCGTYSCERVGFWKPSPAALERIQQDFGIRPEQHLHIGDRLDADGLACARNGCRFLLI